MYHLRIFGFVAYRHISGQLRKKLCDKGEMVILVGYDSTSGYNLFDAINKRVVTNRDVIFDEMKPLQ